VRDFSHAKRRHTWDPVFSPGFLKIKKPKLYEHREEAPSQIRKSYLEFVSTLAT
jgi:hypothetical protein